MIYTHNTKLETLNQDAELPKEKYSWTREKAGRTDNTVQIPKHFFESF